MTDLAALQEMIEARATGRDRLLVAISGPPGSGKSTVAESLADRLGPGACVLPMDGFHLDNPVLRALGLFDRRGAPETFDAQGFVNLIRRLRDTDTVRYPIFDRQADRAIPNAGEISATTRIVLVEGNYLLLDTPPWSDLAALFDLTVALEVDVAELETRLITRWLHHGLPKDQALARARGNDLRNATHIVQNSRPPEVLLHNEG